MYEELIKKIILNEFKTDEFKFKELTKLGNSRVYLIFLKSNNFILRITNKPYSIENNVYALQILKNENISPRIICNNYIENYRYSIETYSLGKYKKKIEKRDIPLIIEKLKLIHNNKSSRCGYLNNLSNDWSKFVREELIEKYKNKFLSQYNNSKYIDYALNNLPNSEKFCFLHGDINRQNLIFQKKNISFIDFEDCFYGEEEYDIGYFHFKYLFPEKVIDIILYKSGYDYWKILYYALCVGIRKIALCENKKDLKNKIKKINEIYNQITYVRKIVDKEYILFSQILTEQEEVRKYRLDTFKRFIQFEGKLDLIKPVFVIPIENERYFGYLLLNGNHRCRAALDLGQPGIEAYIGEPFPVEDAHIKRGRKIEELKINDNVIKEDKKFSKWSDKNFFRNI